MKRSTDRILVTHVGSLARPKDLMEMLVARNEGKSYDSGALAKRTREAVAEVVQKQIECGVDIVNDGELGKSNFSRYTRERLSGFVERAADPNFKPTSIFGRDMIEFNEYFNRGGQNRHRPSRAGFLLRRTAQVCRPGRSEVGYRQS